MSCGCPHAEARDRALRARPKAVLLDAQGRVLGRFRTRAEALRKGKAYVARTGQYARVETPAKGRIGRERTHTVDTRRDPMSFPARRPGDEAYENREAADFHRQLREVARAPLRDRQEACREFFEAMRDHPDVVGERIGWLIDGNYGFGAGRAANDILRNRRMNRAAWLTQTVGALEWQCPQDMLVRAWKKLSPSEKAKLERAVEREISSALAEGSNGRDPRRRRRRARRRDPSQALARRQYKGIQAMMRRYPGDGGGSSRPSRRSRRR